MNMLPQLRLGVAEAAAALRRGEVSSTQLTRACLERIQQTRALNAFVAVTAEEALRQAEQADKRLLAGAALSPLDGVPIACKDNFATELGETTCASRMLRGYRSPFTATTVRRLLDAGAVLLGKTNMDEFGMGSSTTDSVFGATANPWSAPGRNLVAGGSSGGSACAIAADLAFGATASDTGGSVRLPAAFCGVVGLKPSYGLCSRFGLVAYASSMDTPSFMGKRVADVRALLFAAAGLDERDSTSVAAPPELLRALSAHGALAARPMAGLRVAVPDDYHVEELSAEALAVWHRAAGWLREQGAEVASVRLPSTQLALPVYYIIASAEAASNLARYDGVRYGFAGGDRGESGGQDDSSARLLDELRPAQLLAWRRSAGFGAEVKRRILLGNFVLSSQAYSAYVDKAQRIRALIAAEFQSLFAERRFDAVLTPTATGAAPLAASLGAERARQPVSAFLNDVMTTPANLAGLPAVAVPAGHNAEGLPLSVQVMAPHLRDDTALAVAEAIERAAGFQRPELPRARERKFSHAER